MQSVTGDLQSSAGASPEVGDTVQTGPIVTNYHDVGSGDPVLLIHGSGPGVSAWANWRLVLPRLSPHARLIAPDMAGFGYSHTLETFRFDLDMWLGQVVDLLDHLGLKRVSVVGNSFGGGLALHLASRYPAMVDRLILMGSTGGAFPLTEGLDKVWGYTPTVETMRQLIRIFAWNQDIATDELVELRYKASIRDSVQERFAALFPAPRQRWIDALALPPEALARVRQPTLLVHGREDRVIPLEASETLAEHLPNARLEVIEGCGHWVQIEKTDQFVARVAEFLGVDGEHGK